MCVCVCVCVCVCLCVCVCTSVFQKVLNLIQTFLVLQKLKISFTIVFFLGVA